MKVHQDQQKVAMNHQVIKVQNQIKKMVILHQILILQILEIQIIQLME